MIDKRIYAAAAAAVLLLTAVVVFALRGDADRPPAAAAPGPTPTRTGQQPDAPQPEATATQRGDRIGQPTGQNGETTQGAQPDRRPLAVMIENHPDARPQSGLQAADVVYEAPAEFGIPRFLAIYVNKDVETLGPVRSARTYYVAWASEYEPLFVSAGGSPRALSWIKQLEMDHLDALRAGGSAFERTTDRIAPHNLYTDTEALRELIEENPKWKQEKGSWGGLQFSSKPTVGPEEGLELTLTYPTGYSVTYYYDDRSGTYKREMEGEPHLDRETEQQLAASAIVVQDIRMWEIEGDRYGRLEAQVQDKGSALVFQNGRVVEATWEKDKRDSPTKYTTKDGQPLMLKPGQVWIQMAPKGTKIEY